MTHAVQFRGQHRHARSQVSDHVSELHRVDAGLFKLGHEAIEVWALHRCTGADCQSRSGALPVDVRLVVVEVSPR